MSFVNQQALFHKHVMNERTEFALSAHREIIGLIVLGQGIFWQTVYQSSFAIGKAKCGTRHLPTRDG